MNRMRLPDICEKFEVFKSESDRILKELKIVNKQLQEDHTRFEDDNCLYM